MNYILWISWYVNFKSTIWCDTGNFSRVRSSRDEEHKRKRKLFPKPMEERDASVFLKRKKITKDLIENNLIGRMKTIYAKIARSKPKLWVSCKLP